MKGSILLIITILAFSQSILSQSFDEYKKSIKKHKIEYIITSQVSGTYFENGLVREYIDTLSIQKYNKEGNIIAYYYYNLDKEIDSSLYFYDDDKLISLTFSGLSMKEYYSYNSNGSLKESIREYYNRYSDTISEKHSTNYLYEDTITYIFYISNSEIDTSKIIYKDSLDYKIKLTYDLVGNLMKKEISQNDKLISIYNYNTILSSQTSQVYIVSKRKKNNYIKEAKHYGHNGTYWGKDSYKYKNGLLKKWESSTGTYYLREYSYVKFK